MKKYALTLIALVMQAFFLCAGAATMPTVSTDGQETWYYIQFTTGGNVVADQGDGQEVITAQGVKGSAAQLWKVEGSKTAGYTFTNKLGHKLYVTANTQNNGFFRAATTPTTTYTTFVIRENLSKDGFLIAPKGTSTYMNQWGGAGVGKRLGLWNSNVDANSMLVFVEESEFTLPPTVYLGYARPKDEIYAEYGFSAAEDARTGAAIRLTKEMLQPWVGCEITYLNVGWDANTTGKYDLFVSDRLGDASHVLSQKQNAAVKLGWNMVKLDTPVLITEEMEELYVGLYHDAKKGECFLPKLYPNVSAGKCYMYQEGNYWGDGTEAWDDITQLGFQTYEPTTLPIHAMVSDPQNLAHDRASIGELFYEPIVKKDMSAARTTSYAVMQIKNEGSNTISNVTLVHEGFGHRYENNVTLSKGLEPSFSSWIRVPISAYGSGEQSLTVTKVNGVEKAEPFATTTNQILVPPAIASLYPHKNLLEFYCSEGSDNSLKYYGYILDAMKKHGDKYIIVPQHMKDQLMLGDDEATRMALDFANGDSLQIYVPAFSINRSMQMCEYDPSYGSFAGTRLPISYVYFYYDEPGAPDKYNEASQSPSFASLTVAGELEKDAVTVKAHVTGKVAAGIMPEGEKLYCTVYVMEREVESTGQEFEKEEDAIAAGGISIQPTVLRRRLTPMYGQEIDYSTGTFTLDVEGTLNPEWDNKKMYLVAFINRGFENDNFHRNVINAAEGTLTVPEDAIYVEPEVDPVKEQHTFYSFCPHSVPPSTDVVSAGTGTSNYFSAAVSFDPAADPVFARLKGQKIVGVRCFLRTDYKQMFDERSYVMLSEDAPVDEASKALRYQYANFTEGWNDVYFDEPFTIGDKPVFVGYSVFETFGQSYPAVSYNPGIVSHTPGGYYVNLGREGWQESQQRGTLLIEAILSDEAQDLLDQTVYTQVASAPLMIEPLKQVAGSLLVKNLSKNPISEIDILNEGQFYEDVEQPETHMLHITFDTPLEPFEGRTIASGFYPGEVCSRQSTVTLTPTAIDGAPVAAARPGVTEHFVSEDAFTRIPLIEEFTSQMCYNCPRMAYYLHKALHQYNGPLLFCTHHTGFANDAFTQPEDRQLLYLFNSDNTFNPAIMFDRSIIEGESLPVLSTPATNVERYLEIFEEISMNPAMAEVNVVAEKDDDMLNVTVSGRINRGVLAESTPLYISTYLVEDGLPYSIYPQEGMDNPEAPEDLNQVLTTHDGVIRKYLTQGTGDLLTCNPLDGTFTIEYPALEWDTKKNWNWDKCQVISFIHYYNPTDVMQNANLVLNAGSNKYSDPDGIVFHPAQQAQGAANYYDLSGRRVALPQKNGIYIINGKKVVL